jgi:hypothetical protein
VVLTTQGEAAYAAATALQIPWVNALAREQSPDEIAGACALLRTLRRRLEHGTPDTVG